MPLVELCGSEHTSAATIERARELYSDVGMSPLHVRTEIDGFIADRLMEAMWREALWLIEDDVATATEIDAAVRLGPGLRWAFMGPFLTYRIAGGEAGMRHFMAQFGPVAQVAVDEADGRAGAGRRAAREDRRADRTRSRPAPPTTELERMRDDCLVDILLALRRNEVGAGAVVARAEREALAAAHPRVISDDDDLSQPLALHSATVSPEWVDYNGHAHESRYLQMFGDSSDALLGYLGIDEAYRADTGSYFTAETHLSHLRELKAGDTVDCDDADPRRRPQAAAHLPPHDRHGDGGRGGHRRAHVPARGRRDRPRRAGGR